jgi:predicted Zn-dependent protease
MMNTKKILFVVLIVSLLFACATTGPGGKKDLIFISSAQEVSLGVEFDKSIRAESKIFANQRWQDYFNDIGQRLVAVSDRKDIQYNFKVIESDDINAFATPGGYVYIYPGLLRIIDNEAQLAAVTSHEISHVVARHSIKRLQQVLGITILQEIVLGESTSETLETAIAVGMSVALSGYSRSNEKEADKYGVYYMELAGFNPIGAEELFTNMKAASGNVGERSFFENMLSSHPETNIRIENVKTQAATYTAQVLNRDKGKTRFQQMKRLLPKPEKK